MRPLILLAAATLSAAPLSAQERVRWTTSRGQFEGRVQSTEPSGRLVVTMANSAASVVIDPDTIRTLYHWSGGASRGTNALIGMAIGGAIGVMAGYASGDDECGEGIFGCIMTFTAGQKAGMGAILGIPLGALIGSAMHAGHWVPWENGGRLRTAIGVTQTGAAKLGLRISF